MAATDEVPPTAAPLIRCGHGNTPVFVDASADPAASAQHIAASVGFDNGLMAGAESLVFAHEECLRDFKKELAKAGAHLASEAESDAVRKLLFSAGIADPSMHGRSAGELAADAGFKISGRCKVIVTELSQVGAGEQLSLPKLAPVVGLMTVRSATQGIAMSRALLRLDGRGHTAAVHATTPSVVMAFSAAVEASRVIVNGPAVGFAADSNSVATPLLGLGAFGGSAAGGGLAPQYFVQMTRIVCRRDATPDGTALAQVKLELPGAIAEAPADGVARRR